MKVQIHGSAPRRLPVKLLLMLRWCLVVVLATGIQQSVTAHPSNKVRFVPIRGKVSDSKGAPLVGISITITGKAGGATTDSKGDFIINAAAGDELSFSGIGFTTQILRVGAETTVNVILADASSQLDDVVVVGYGTQRRKDVTGAITSVKLEGTPKATVPLVNALEALQGTAGINIGPSTTAGASPNIVVRGQNSVTARTNPLIVLDGVIFNGDLNEINMNDVASYDVLKDASSAAIYGSRSANGVVIITTKRGKSEKPQINFNTYYGLQSWTRIPKMRGPEAFLQWRKNNLGATGADTADITKVLSAIELKAFNEGHSMDWLDEVTQRAPIQNYELSVSGRAKNLNYYFSAGFLDQKGVLYNDNYKKPNVTIKLENTITDWLSYGINGYYSSRDYSGISPNLYMATYMSPYSYKYVDGSSSILQRFPAQSTSLFNPYWGNTNLSEPGYYDDDMEKYTNIRGTGFINIKFPFIKGLNYRFNFTANRGTSELGFFHHQFGEVNTLIPAQIANPDQFLSRTYGTRTNSVRKEWLMDNLLTYNKSFGDHSFDVLAGYTRDHSQSEGVLYRAADFAAIGTTSLGFYGLGNGTNSTGSTTFSEFSNIGYIGRLNYSFKDRYFATFNFRRDANSAFTPGQQFGNFPGGSVAWDVSDENFMKKVTFVDYLKLRVSYGQTGNQGIDPYSTIPQVTTGFTVFGSTPFLFTLPATLGNKSFTWEKTRALNIGTNFTLFKNRISGNIEVYKSNTVDQLISRLIPIMTGYNSVNSNRGEVENRGLEISLNTVNIKSSNGFSWESGISFWMNRNKLVHLNGLDGNGDGKEDDDIDNGLFIGKSLGGFYDYTFDGIVQTADAAFKTANPGFVDGDVKFKDISGPDGKPDGIITQADRSVIGYAKENFNFNVSNTFSYKNFSLYFSVNAIIGGGKNNFFLSTNVRSLNPGQAIPTAGNWLDQPYWTKKDANNEFPRSNYTNPLGYGFQQSRTFARVQNLSFSYALPQPMLERLKISNLRLYVSGTNLVTLTGWTGLDPANGAQIGGNGGSTNNAVNRSQPLMRALTFGLNLGL